MFTKRQEKQDEKKGGVADQRSVIRGLLLFFSYFIPDRRSAWKDCRLVL